MPNRGLGLAALLMAALAGCGGGSAGLAAGKAPAKVLGAIDEEGGTKPGGTPAAGAAAGAKAAPKIDTTLIPEPGAPLVRETYAYAGGSRDPFASVLEGGSIGPELADLDLVAIYFQPRSGSTSVAVLRDRVSGKSYTVHEGERLGRARVSDVREKDVTFTIDDYGTQRQVTLSLRKREDNTP